MTDLTVYSQLAKQADDDQQFIDLWLRGKRSAHTRRAYQADAERFTLFVRKPLQAVTLKDLEDYKDSLASLAPTSQARTLAAIKSLLSFGQKVGYLQFNVGKAFTLPSHKDTLAERILSESQVQKMLALEPKPRNQVLLRLLYAAGLRVSELCRLTWRDVKERGEDKNGKPIGQITAYGKGDKTRAVVLPAGMWADLETLRPANASPNEPVFKSRKKAGRLDPSQVLRIVRTAAKRAGIAENVSPHWLRHAHATHALERSAPIHLVQATLGHSSVQTTGRYLHARPTESSASYLPV